MIPRCSSIPTRLLPLCPWSIPLAQQVKSWDSWNITQPPPSGINSWTCIDLFIQIPNRVMIPCSVHSSLQIKRISNLHLWHKTSINILLTQDRDDTPDICMIYLIQIIIGINMYTTKWRLRGWDDLELFDYILFLGRVRKKNNLMSGTSLKKLGLFQGCWKLLRARGVSAKGASRAAGANRTKETFCYVLLFFFGWY